ncbi:MAG: YkoF family thiamine/hydroxymethylpyrimidine-binding protein [Steroidobacteraceae bacterium]|jgi:uncharacterized protein YqgV (UPF0045/DUF77 family)
MDVGVEISLYPLHQQYIGPIKDFIERINAEGDLRIITNSMSTQIFGDFDKVMQRLVREVRTSLANQERNQDKAVFVLKILGPMTT